MRERVVVHIEVEITEFNGRDLEGRHLSDDEAMEMMMQCAMKSPEFFFDGAKWRIERWPR